MTRRGSAAAPTTRGGAHELATARAPLSRNAILEVAMRLAESEGATQLSLTRLGRALGVDPTALYRHFRDKDDLLLALADLLIQEAVALMRPEDHWADTLRSIALRLRGVFLARPALAQQIAARFTGGDGELELRDHILAALGSAGLHGVAAARECRAFVEMTLASVALSATLLSLPTELQKQDVLIGLRIYASSTVPPARSQSDSVRAEEDAVFQIILNHYLLGLSTTLPS